VSIFAAGQSTFWPSPSPSFRLPPFFSFLSAFSFLLFFSNNSVQGLLDVLGRDGSSSLPASNEFAGNTT
jgi:hypothetical protein